MIQSVQYLDIPNLVYKGLATLTDSNITTLDIPGQQRNHVSDAAHIRSTRWEPQLDAAV